MNQRQNRSNQPEIKVQFKAKNSYKAGGSPKNVSSNISTQKKATEYKKINNTTTNKDKILHHSVKRNFDKEGNAIITTKIVREIGSEKGGKNNSKSMLNTKQNTRNISYGINNEQSNKYMHYSNYSNTAEEDNTGIIYDTNYEMFSPASYNAQIHRREQYTEYGNIGTGVMGRSPGVGISNLNHGQISPGMPNYVRSNEFVGQKSSNYKRTNREYISNNQNMSSRYNNYNLESPYNLSSNDFTSPDRQYDYGSKYFRNVQIEKIKGKQPMYQDKINLRNNQYESSVEYNGYQDRDEELYEMVDNMATLIQSNVRGFLVRKKVLRFITLAIYYQSFCDKLQDVLCIHVRKEVLNILKNKLINNKNKYGNKYGNKYTNINTNNISYINAKNNQNTGKHIHTSNSYYKSYQSESNYRNNNTSNNTNINNIHNYNNPHTNNYTTRKELIEYSTYRNTPMKGTGKEYTGIYETSKIYNTKKLKKNASFQNNLTSNFNRSYKTSKYQTSENQSPSSRVIHYFVNSPCSNKTPHQRYYHEINTKTTKAESHDKNQLNHHRTCHRCDEIRRMKKQEKFYITTTTEKAEDEYEKYEYEKNIKYNQSTQDIYTQKKDIENDNYLSVNILKLQEKEKSKSTRDIFTSTTHDPNKIAKVESLNIKTTKKQKTEKEIEEEINRRVKITITEHEKIEKEKRFKEEQERKEKERIQREKEKEKEKERIQKEKERKEKEEQIRKEKEKERKEKEEQIKKEKMERERIQKEKEKERREEQEKKRKEKEEQIRKEKMERERKEKERREEQIRIEKEKEKKRREQIEKERKEKEERIKKEREEKILKEKEERKKKEEQMRIEKEKQRKLKEEQMRLEQDRRDKERVRKLQEEITRMKKITNIQTIKKVEEKKINMSDYILKKDCQKNMEDMKTKLAKEYEKKIEMEKKKGLEEQKRYEERIEIQNRKEIEKIIEQQKRKEIERQRELEKEKEMQKRKELELQKQREKEIQMGIKQEMEKQKELMKQKELEEKNKKIKQMKINKVQEVNLKSIFPNQLTTKKVDEKILEKNKEKALKLIKKFILFRGNYLLKLRKYFHDWRIVVKNLELQEYSKAIQDFCRTKLEITSIKRVVGNWKKLSKKIYYKRRIKILKMRPKMNIKKRKLYELIRITKLNRAFSRRRYIHYMILVWYIYAKNIHRKRVNMKFLYENLLKTYMSLAKDIFGNNQFENPSVQDAMYEAVNTNKFSTSYQDDVPLAKKHYAEMRRKKLLEAKNKGEYSSSTTKVEIEKKEMKKSYYSKEKVITDENDEESEDEKKKKELLNKFRKYKSMRRDLIWQKQNRYIASMEKNYSSEENDEKKRDYSEDKNYRKINNNDYKINKTSTTMKKTYEENKSYTKPIENKYNSNYNTTNYNKAQGQKNIEIKEYKKVTEDSKYNNTSYPSRKNKSENKDIVIKTNVYNNTNTNNIINTSKYTTNVKTSGNSGNTGNVVTTQTTIKKTYSTLNKPITSGNQKVSNVSNVKSYAQNLNISTSNNSIKISPSTTGYKKTEVTKTTYTKEESKPYLTKNIVTTKKVTTGNSNTINNNNISVVSSSYHNNKDNNKISYGSQSGYLKTDGNIKDKTESKIVTTKVEKKVEIKSNINKEGKDGKKIITTKSYTTTRTNQ